MYVHTYQANKADSDSDSEVRLENVVQINERVTENGQTFDWIVIRE